MVTGQAETLGKRIESIPKTILFFLFGFTFLVLGFLLEVGGMPREAGLAGALSAILMGLAVLVYLIYWVLGQLD